jgi:hypothetical protein
MLRLKPLKELDPLADPIAGIKEIFHHVVLV